MKSRFQLLRGDLSARDAGNDAPSSENPVGQVTITLLELSGVEYHSLEGKNTSDVVPKKKKGLSRRLGLLGGKDTISSTDAGNDDMPLTASPTPAKVVVWCQQNESKSSSKSMPKYLSGCMIEESIDDEGNVVSWSCVWPHETSSFNVPLPLTHDKNKKNFISLGLGLQLPGQNEIQPLGVVTVEQSTLEEVHPLLEVMDLSIPVAPLKQKRSLSSKFGITGSKKCKYSISPSTVLKLELQVDSGKTSSTKSVMDPELDGCPSSSSPVDDPMTKKYQEYETNYVGTDAMSTSSVFTEVGMDPSSSGFKATAVSVECSKTALDGCPSLSSPDDDLMTKKDQGYGTNSVGTDAMSTSSTFSEVGTNPSSSESKTATVSVEDSNTVKADNKTVHSVASKGFTIETEESLPEGSTTKPRDWIIAPFGESTIHLVTSSGSVNPRSACDAHSEIVVLQEKAGVEISTEDSKPVEPNVKYVRVKEHDNLKLAGQHGQAQMNETSEHKPLFDVIELNYTTSVVSNDLTVDSFGVMPKVEVSTSQKMIKRATYPEVNCCASSFAEVVDDAVEGLHDIVACGFCIHEVFGDDVTCKTNCTSSESTLNSYDSTLNSHESTLNSHESTLYTFLDVTDSIIRPDAEAVNDSRGKVRAFLARVGRRGAAGTGKEQAIPGTEEKQNTHETKEEQTTLDQSNIICEQTKNDVSGTEKINDSSSVKSSRSLGRLPTPVERKVLKSRYNFDSNLSVSVCSV